MKQIQPMTPSLEAELPKTVESEFTGLQLKPGARVLDAGCGTGVAARELARLYPSAQIEGCDASELQLKHAGRQGGSIQFFRSSLEKLERPSDTYDLVVCRDVLSLLRDPRPAATELLRVLKPGGHLIAIEYDGLFCNLFPATPPLRHMLHELETGLEADLRMGRKLPGLLDSIGFDEITWDVSAMSFQGDALVQENRTSEQRLAFAMPAIEKTLGTSNRAENFRRMYLEEMRGPGAIVFYNKFVVRGRK